MMKNLPSPRWLRGLLATLTTAALPAALVSFVLLSGTPAVVSAQTTAPAATTTAADPDTIAVANAYDSWLKTVSTADGDPAPMLKFYSPDAILVATYSPVLLHNDNGELAGYFKKFTALPYIQGSTEDLQTRVYGDFAINTGLYTFTFQTPEGEKVAVPARFTFVYRKVGDQWLIVDHHSSMVPPSL
jgi:uncharacterized protein (TIGR02246 family)